MIQRKIILLFVCMLCGGSLFAQSLPNATNFLPGPPSTSSMEYVKDYMQYSWGKAQRNTDKGTQAKSDMSSDVTAYTKVFSSLMGINISQSETPNLYTLFDYGMKMGEEAVSLSQIRSFRERPYVKFSDPTLLPDSEDYYSSTGSYPATPAMLGWLYSMMMTEIAPENQNALLARGYDYGRAPIIAGYNWDSDVVAGRLLATALLAYFHNDPGYNNWVTAAKSEYSKKSSVRERLSHIKLFSRGSRADGDSAAADSVPADSTDTVEVDTVIIIPDTAIVDTIPVPVPEPKIEPYLTKDDLPDIVRYLEGVPDSLSILFGYDMMQHIDGKAVRRKSTGTVATNDVNMDIDYFSEIFSSALGFTISKSDTPDIYELLLKTLPLGEYGTQTAKDQYMRFRPYVRLKETTSYVSDEDELSDTGSYASAHATTGWLLALVLSEIAPSAEEALLLRAYTYGQGRVVTGYCWQSDVDAGRLAAGAICARLHADAAFLEKMRLAKIEYEDFATGIISARNSSSRSVNDDDNVYNLNGVRVTDTPNQRGIYIRGNQKVIY